MPACRVSEMCEKTVQRPRFIIVSSMYYGRQEIAQFSTILICKILLTQPVPQAGLNTPPAGVYSNQEYLKYSGFEYTPAGGVFKPAFGIGCGHKKIMTSYLIQTSKSAMQNFVVET